MASVKKRGDGWTVRWLDYDTGASRRRQCPDKATADAVARAIEQAHALGRAWRPHSRGAAPEVVEELIPKYLEDRARIWSARSLERQEVSLSVFGAWLLARQRTTRVSPAVLSSDLLAAYWEHCRAERKVSIRTANVRVRDVFNAWTWWEAHETYGHHVPRPRMIDLPRVPRERVLAPSWAQMDSAIAHAPAWYRDLFTVLRCTGLRRKQAMALTWDDVDLEAKTLRIRPELGKSLSERAGRTVPLAPVLVAELAGWGVREGPLVKVAGRHAQKGKPRKSRLPHGAMLRRAWKLAGVPEEVWKRRPAHAFRKGFKSGLRALGAHPDAIDYLQGHDLGVRGVYTDPEALDLEAVVALVPALGQPPLPLKKKARGSG